MGGDLFTQGRTNFNIIFGPGGPNIILKLVRGTSFNIIFGPMGPILGGTIFNVTALNRHWEVLSMCNVRELRGGTIARHYT